MELVGVAERESLVQSPRSDRCWVLERKKEGLLWVQLRDP